jgi:hypothetical protein
MNQPPRTIYLQWHGDSDPDDPAPVCETEVTWCSDKCFGSDVEYVRADVRTQALDHAAELLFEIMRDDVNAQDEAEKWLRAYAPDVLRRAYDLPPTP